MIAPNVSKAKPCCQVAGKLELVEVDNLPTGTRSMWKCRECGCRHFVFEVKTVHLGLRGSPMGAV